MVYVEPTTVNDLKSGDKVSWTVDNEELFGIIESMTDSLVTIIAFNGRWKFRHAKPQWLSKLSDEEFAWKCLTNRQIPV